MQRSRIEYLRGPDGREGFTWNPVVMRCTPISAGCKNCWHLKFAKRHASNPGFNIHKRCAYNGALPMLSEKELLEPARVRKPSRVAVQFMGDLFHPDVTDYQVESIILVMSRLCAHTFLVLTKRPKRMRELFEANNVKDADNIWAGVSVEGACEVERLRILQATPAAHRWVSFEPLISPVGVNDWSGISWAVVGAETGPHKRPCRQEWIDDLREQCKNAGVKFFGKVDSQGRAIEPREMP